MLKLFFFLYQLQTNEHFKRNIAEVFSPWSFISVWIYFKHHSNHTIEIEPKGCSGVDFKPSTQISRNARFAISPVFAQKKHQNL